MIITKVNKHVIINRQSIYKNFNSVEKDAPPSNVFDLKIFIPNKKRDNTRYLNPDKKLVSLFHTLNVFTSNSKVIRLYNKISMIEEVIYWRRVFVSFKNFILFLIKV